jgi:hypothetical protein
LLDAKLELKEQKYSLLLRFAAAAVVVNIAGDDENVEIAIIYIILNI